MNSAPIVVHTAPLTVPLVNAVQIPSSRPSMSLRAVDSSVSISHAPWPAISCGMLRPVPGSSVFQNCSRPSTKATCSR